MFLLSIRKVLDEDLDEDILEEAEGDVTLLAPTAAGGTSSEKVQKFAVEKLLRLDLSKTTTAMCRLVPAQDAVVSGLCESFTRKRQQNTYHLLFFDTTLSELLDAAIGNKKIYCKMPDEARCLQGDIGGLADGARTLFRIPWRSIRSILPILTLNI